MHENACEQIAIVFAFASDWLGVWSFRLAGSVEPITIVSVAFACSLAHLRPGLKEIATKILYAAPNARKYESQTLLKLANSTTKKRREIDKEEGRRPLQGRSPAWNYFRLLCRCRSY